MPAEERRPAEEPDDDAVWTQLVASFHASDAEPDRRWPAREDRTEDVGGEGPTRATAPVTNPQGARPPAAHAYAPVDAEDHFVPPPPPPLPRGDRISRAAWAAVLGIPVLLIVATLLGWRLSSMQAGLVIAAFVVGFVTLVARMRTSDPYDPSNGAVV